jgi:uncharacterized protein YndB with AHSA1/START domain
VRDDANAERGYTITRVFAGATPQMVWDAWTTPERFAHWWGTADTKVEDVAMDVRPGGAWRARMVLPDRSIDWAGEFLELDPPRRLVMTVTDAPDEPSTERFTVTIDPEGDDTRMTVRQSGGNLPDDEYERARVGTNSFLDSMEQLLHDEVLKMRHDTGGEPTD